MRHKKFRVGRQEDFLEDRRREEYPKQSHENRAKSPNERVEERLLKCQELHERSETDSEFRERPQGRRDPRKELGMSHCKGSCDNLTDGARRLQSSFQRDLNDWVKR